MVGLRAGSDSGRGRVTPASDRAEVVVPADVPRVLRVEKLEEELREAVERIARLEYALREALGVDL